MVTKPTGVRRAQTRPALSLAALALAAVSSGWALQPAAAEEPAQVRVVWERTGPRTARVSAQLTNCTEVTLTLHLTLTNAVASAPLPLTVDSAGRTCFELLTLRAASEQGAWGYGGSYEYAFGRRGDAGEEEWVYELPYKGGPYEVSQSGLGVTHTEGSGSEHAIDWAMPHGTVVCAAREGTVVALRHDSTVGVKDPTFARAGNFIVIRHDDGTFAEYVHLKRKGALVWLGQRVARQAVIGFSGDTGYSSGPHLHFCVYQNIDARTRRSFPVRFRTKSGSVETLKAGQAY